MRDGTWVIMSGAVLEIIRTKGDETELWGAQRMSIRAGALLPLGECDLVCL